jgi:putative copper resistance protein D
MPMPMLPPLTWSRAFTAWTAHPLLLGLAGLAVLGYLVAVQALNSRHPRARWPRRRTVAFLAGVGVVVFAVCGGPGVYGEVLFWVHMVRHLLLIMVAPWLLALGYPVTLALRATRGSTHRRLRAVLRSAPVTVATNPLVITAAYLVVVAGVHLTGFMQAMAEHPVLGPVENAAYLVAGCLFCSAFLTDEPSRWDRPYPIRLFLGFVAMMADTIVGVILLQTATVPWPAYAQPHRGWGPSPLEDLHWGGAVMWIGGDGLMLAMMTVQAVRWLTDPRAQAAGAGRWLESARRAALANLDHTANVDHTAGTDRRVTAGTGTDRADDAGPATSTATGTAGSTGGRAILASTDVDDDDAALAAYNAMLARLAGHSAPSAPPPDRPTTPG